MTQLQDWHSTYYQSCILSCGTVKAIADVGFKLISLVLTVILNTFQIHQPWPTHTGSILTMMTSSQVKMIFFHNATKELGNVKHFSLLDSDPILITIIFAVASSHVYWNNTCTIATIYDDSGVGSVKKWYVAESKKNSSPTSLLRRGYVRQILIWFQNHIRDVLKIDSANKDSDRSIFQRRASSRIIVTLKLCCSRATTFNGTFQREMTAG